MQAWRWTWNQQQSCRTRPTRTWPWTWNRPQSSRTRRARAWAWPWPRRGAKHFAKQDRRCQSSLSRSERRPDGATLNQSTDHERASPELADHVANAPDWMEQKRRSVPCGSLHSSLTHPSKRAVPEHEEGCDDCMISHRSAPLDTAADVACLAGKRPAALD